MGVELAEAQRSPRTGPTGPSPGDVDDAEAAHGITAAGPDRGDGRGTGAYAGPFFSPTTRRRRARASSARRPNEIPADQSDLADDGRTWTTLRPHDITAAGPDRGDEHGAKAGAETLFFPPSPNEHDTEAEGAGVDRAEA